MTVGYYEFFCPVKILAGDRALEQLAYELSERGAERPMLVTDAGVERANLLAPVETALAESEVRFAATFDDVPSDSSTEVVARGAAIFRAHRCDSIVAVGGGSVMDTCKGMNVLVSKGGDDLHRYLGAGALGDHLKPFVAIPTTSGTGSEVTVAAVITDVERGVKLPLTAPVLLPDVAVVDPRMTLTLPPFLTAATAMDAFTHAVEAYIGLAKNPLSDAFATTAIALIARSLPRVLDEPQDVAARFDLAQAATIAGIAFSSSMTSLVHALGHQVGALCHLHHGLCMGLLLPYALDYNRRAREKELGELLLYLEGPDVYARTPRERRADATLAAIRRLRDRLHDEVGLPRTLAESGKVRHDQLATLAQMALDDGAIVYNPVAVNRDDALAVLEAAWG